MISSWYTAIGSNAVRIVTNPVVDMMKKVKGTSISTIQTVFPKEGKTFENGIQTYIHTTQPNLRV